MHLNENIKLLGNKIILAPYEARHVPKYHDWMSNETLRQLTASEELTLSEEYLMQQSWREDSDKLTFIILAADIYARDNDEIAAMVGDTNLFLRHDPDTNERVAEAEIMIAEPQARGTGYGREAMLLMLKYAQSQLQLHKFEVKIDMDNAVSLRLFESFQFVETARVKVFHEVTMQREITTEWIDWLDQQVELRMVSYNG
ncbi:N-acetyltransferase 9-like protein [Drosophila guanche]|uniref:Blast:N-acetyltransferase 9-like protein n=1 Tax=Drosophila guanche TaxID=7266 RepID=A0A3B0JJK8_DROGU|nr:N-acetyltransferase 9-like protein [Drosophila guanche]SPP80512.1 blast:N-acetyltransferase 9-like protein [Drosophila guanche]